MAQPSDPALTARVWEVGALCRAIAESLDARFNPVAVRGEVSGFSRASSGHWYFSLKDSQGQVRCAMFRRAAGLSEFMPRDGELVQAWGRLGVYEARGDLQLIVESLSRVGQGALFEQFLRLKAQLEGEGLFNPARKRPVPALPRGIGLVTSQGAAALHDVVTCLRRRAPHVPVVLAPAAVQGAQAPRELVGALESLYALAHEGLVEVILLVRGGGSLEDLWAFNDEQLARAITRSPVPIVCGIGHETDFTIADFCADLRAPTPTAAAELAARPLQGWVEQLEAAAGDLQRAAWQRLDAAGQRLDQAGARLGRPSNRISGQRLTLQGASHRLGLALQRRLQGEVTRADSAGRAFRDALRRRLALHQDRLGRSQLGLELLDPKLVLRRGYAWVTDGGGRAVTRAQDLLVGQALRLQLSQGQAEVTVDALLADGADPVAAPRRAGY